MQVTKTYSGEVTLEDAAVKRLVSYGVSTTVSVYPSKVDTVNSIIAEFLSSECGVDAVYASGGGEDTFLWIYGAPFLFSIAGSNSYAAFYGPMYGSALNSGSESGTQYNAGTSKLFNGDTGTYSFGLVFAGNPNTGFSLRFKPYNSRSVSGNFVIRIMKCVNLINGLDSVVWSAVNVYSSGNNTDITPLLGGMNGIDLEAGGAIKEDSFSNTLLSYDPLLHTKAIHRTSNDSALPLVPLCIGPYRANGIYLRPYGFALPNAASITTEVQAEITVSGRSFLVTNSDSLSAGYINMGLIETT